MAPSRWSRLRWYCLFTLALLASGVAYFCEIQAGGAPSTARFDHWIIDAPLQPTWMWIGIGSTLIAVGGSLRLAYVKDRKASAALAELAHANLVVVGIAIPIAALLGELTDLPAGATVKRASLQAKAPLAVVSALAGHFEQSLGVRARYLAVDGTASHRTLTITEQRGGSPFGDGAKFVEGTALSDPLFKSMDAQQSMYWTSKDQGNPPLTWSQADPFAAYVSVPVFTKGKIFGLLTIDAQDQEAFTFPRDARTADLLARLLAAGLNL